MAAVEAALTLLDLPVELITAVADYVASSGGLRGLSRLGRTCRRVSALMLRLLHRAVQDPGSAQTKFLLRKAGAECAASVRSLSISRPGPKDLKRLRFSLLKLTAPNLVELDMPLTTYTGSHIGRALVRAENLRRFRLVIGANGCSWLDKLDIPASIPTVEIDYRAGSDAWTAFWKLVARSPNLRRLRLLVEYGIADKLASIELPASVRSVELDFRSIRRSWPALWSFIARFPRNLESWALRVEVFSLDPDDYRVPQDSLSGTLSVAGLFSSLEVPPTAFGAFVALPGLSIRHLTLIDCLDFSYYDSWWTAFRSLNSLRTLTIVRLASELFLRYIPPSVEKLHLEEIFFSNTPPGMFTDIRRALRALPKLKSFTCTFREYKNSRGIPVEEQHAWFNIAEEVNTGALSAADDLDGPFVYNPPSDADDEDL
ncbi:hypothetical protein DFJ74DRAFT_396563 [Hyaloraphidium curvatum]|nr:hypothetical protein DFJ74DRAFT_396563 [Hyaloraphidium curvatum]